MGAGGTFNRLALELSLEERLNLLEKLNGQSNLSKEPLYEDEKDEVPTNPEERYDKIPWYYHLWFFILSFFLRKPPAKIYGDRILARIGRIVESRAPGYYTYHRDTLLPEFYKELVNMKEGARFFYTALDASINRDKGAFYAFLGSLEMGEIHQRLSAETDPNLAAEKNPDASEQDLRQLAFKAMEDNIAAVTEEQRNLMYMDTRALHCLKELSSFLFDRVIMAFSFEPSIPGQICAAHVVKDQLLVLNNILYSLKEIPSMTLLESLFIFLLQERVGEANFDINREIRDLLDKAESAITAIRNFNRQVPLTLILRCACRDTALSPRAVSGGEDWFVVYRDYWKRHVEMRLTEYMRQRRHRDLTNSFRYFLKGTNLKVLGNVVSESNPDGLPINGAFSLSFLLTFYSVVFMNDINRVIRPILIDGEFYKRENRTEFTEAYNELIKLEDVIKKFEAEISPSGDYGKRYAHARSDMTSLPVKRRKIQMVLEDASGEAVRIIDQAKDAINSMINVLSGILKKDASAKYDTLSNMSSLAGKGSAFAAGVADSVQKFQKTLQLLKDIDMMEIGR